jgi:hypothetical protein
VVGGQEQLEEQNSAKVSVLSDKVREAKYIAIAIREELKVHNEHLFKAGTTIDKVGDLLVNSIGKVKQLAKSGYRYYFRYLFLFCLFAFVVLWFYI